MGIQDLFTLVREHAKDVPVSLKFEDISDLSIAVDISVFFNKMVKGGGADDWLNRLVDLLMRFKRYRVTPEFVFDGPEVPKEKIAEQQRRRHATNGQKDVLERGKVLLEEIRNYRDMKKPPTKMMVKEAMEIMGPIRIKAMEIDFTDIFSLAPNFITVMQRIEKQSSPILPEYISIAKDFIEAFGYTYYQYSGEAEALCSALVIGGYCDAVMSEDSDVLAYGTPVLLRNIQADSFDAIALEDLLKGFGQTFERFRDMCIMLSCDYNQRAKGFPQDGKKYKTAQQLGAKKVFDMMQTFSSIEEALPFIENPEVLIYERCRELFTPPVLADVLPPPKISNPNPKRLKELWAKHNVRRNLDRALDLFKPARMEEIEGSDDDQIESDTESE
jgi:5'-3' exonuclease